MSRVSAGRSSASPSCIGVTIATRLPFSIEHHLKKPAFTSKRHSSLQRHLGERWGPCPSAADGSEPLEHCGRRAIDAPLLEGDDRERFARQLEELTLLKQKVRIRRLAVDGVARREGFVEQQAVRRQGGGQVRKRRAM